MTLRRSLTPSAARLTESLRDIGYSFPAAVADLIDNSVSAGATQVDVSVDFAGPESRVWIVDDGEGMSGNALMEALRFGSRRSYSEGDLGKYGLGLKTASLSQARALTVISRRKGSVYTTSRTLDLDLIAKLDDWLVVEPRRTAQVLRGRDHVTAGHGTVVLWEKLDRVLPGGRPDGAWAKRRLDSITSKTVDHLGMVFHRFIDGTAAARRLVITVNGEKVSPWDPFARHEPATVALPVETFELAVGQAAGVVTLSRFILPARDSFSSQTEFERLSGPLKWNRQQGLYIYRADRLVQWGGWAGIRGIDEHTKLGRAAIDYGTALDPAFNIDVAKMRVALPGQLRGMLERPINELCLRADDAYRKVSKRGRRPDLPPTPILGEVGTGSAGARGGVGLALRSAAVQSGDYPALKRIIAVLREQAPEVLREIGLE